MQSSLDGEDIFDNGPYHKHYSRAKRCCDKEFLNQKKVFIIQEEKQNYVKEKAYKTEHPGIKILKMKVVLEYIFSIVEKHQILMFYHSWSDWKKGFKTTDDATINKILTLLEEMEILYKLERGSNYSGKTSLFLLVLPKDCYFEL